MKKIVLLVVIILVGTWWLYFRNIESPVEKESKNDPESIVNVIRIDTKDNKDNKDTKDTKMPPTLKLGPINNNYKLKETANDQFLAFEKLEKEWLLKAQKIIGADKYAEYLGLRNQNEKEKMQAYKEYHAFLRQKYGDNFSYNISDDQSVREKQINKQYLNDLLKLIGPEKFKLYLAAKDQFNEEMRRNNKESIQIEF